MNTGNACPIKTQCGATSAKQPPPLYRPEPELQRRHQVFIRQARGRWRPESLAWAQFRWRRRLWTASPALCDNLNTLKLSQSVSFYTNMVPRMHVYGKVSHNQILVYMCCCTVRIYVLCRKKCLNICTHTEYPIRIYIYKCMYHIYVLLSRAAREQPTVAQPLWVYIN